MERSAFDGDSETDVSTAGAGVEAAAGATTAADGVLGAVGLGCVS
jgi:hypothetical protein